MWKPITEIELLALLERELSNCTIEQQNVFSTYRVEPYKVPIHRLGKLEDVFVVAELPIGVVYYEDIEEGFEFDSLGPDSAIPKQGCNQYELRHVLSQLKL